MPTANERNRSLRAGGRAGGSPAARSRKASTVGETARSGPARKDTNALVRGYTKLSDAADFFDFDFFDKVVLDIGSSTGGFTQYALDHGAKKVIAVEKGTNQMMKSLRYDKRIDLHEKTNIFSVGVRNTTFEGNPQLLRGPSDEPREVGREERPEKAVFLTHAPDVILADVSFISLRDVLSYAKDNLADKHTEFLVMLKPQFEAKPGQLVKGVVKNEKIRREIIKDFEKWLKHNNFVIINKHDNVLKGKTGNKERFYLLTIAKHKHIINV